VGCFIKYFTKRLSFCWSFFNNSAEIPPGPGEFPVTDFLIAAYISAL
jgi:hypothetical protein